MTTRTMDCLCLVLLLTPACGDPSKPAAQDATAQDAAPVADIATIGDIVAQDAAVDASDAAHDAAPDPFGPAACDPLQPLTCALPFPSSHYLQPDAKTKTGVRVVFPPGALPSSGTGVPVDPKPWERLDGFSVAPTLVAQFAHLDIAGMADQKTIDKSVDKASPTVWLEVDAAGKVLRRIAHWVELDQRPNTEDGKIDPATRMVFVRPGVILNYGTRYVVALRKLKDSKGQVIARSPAFEALASGKTTGTSLAPRQARFDQIFQILQAEGIAKDELTLAWDFSTYSDHAIHGPVLQMRDKALAALGPTGAALTFKTFAAKKDGGTDDPHIAYTLRGTFKAPNFMKEVAADGGELRKDSAKCFRWNLDADGNLQQNGWRDAELWIRVPKSALDGTPHDYLHYGHGLNGSGNETYAGWVGPNANSRKFIYIANSMIGMSGEDGAVIIQILLNIGRFACLSERVAAGVVEHLVLARTMKLHGAAALSNALSGHTGKPVKIADTGKVFWSGNSQGGIYGQTVTALSQDITRAHVGQPGINYHMLLERSIDFDEFAAVLSGVYPKRNEYALLLGVVQMLWDHVDPVTYVRHLEVEPFANTPKHQALAVVHPGDFQVDAVTMEIAVRSGYYKLLPFYGKPVPMVPESAYPLVGSGLIAYDFGNSWFIQGNLPPAPEDGLECGDPALPHADGPCLGKKLCDPKGTFKPCKLEDPHDRAHGLKSHNDQMRHFFDTGEIKDFCGGDGCKPE